jgi:RNA polymerase sigma factor (sigma-70 family)
MNGAGASGVGHTDSGVISASLSSPGCFSLIFERHADTVFRYLASRVDRPVAEDLLSDVFETAFRARRRYDSSYDDALPWLLGIATNMIRHHRRSESRHTSMLRRVAQLRRQEIDRAAADPSAGHVERHEDMQEVRRAMEGLSDTHREILVLCAGLGLSYDDAARTLGVKVGTVRSRLARARTRLRELLESNGQYTAYVGTDQPRAAAEEHAE